MSPCNAYQEDSESGKGGCCDAVPDGDALEDVWSRVALASKEEVSELVPDLLRQGRGGDGNLVESLGVLPPSGRVLDVGDRDGPTHQGVENRSNILLSPLLPLLWLELGQALQTLDHEKHLGTDVLLEVGKFCVNGRLELETLVEATMVLFQDHDPVLEDAGVLVGDGGLQLQVETLLIEELAGTVKKMKHELHAGIGRQMNTIRFEAWCGEAWHQENAGGPILHDVGELLQDLRQALVVPDWGGPIHGWTDEERKVWASLRKLSDTLEELEDDSLGADGSSGGAG